MHHVWFVVKAFAVLQGYFLAQQENWPHVIMEFDSKQVIFSLRGGTNNAHWEEVHVLSRALDIGVPLESCT